MLTNKRTATKITFSEGCSRNELNSACPIKHLRVLQNIQMENFVTVATENVRKFQKIEHWRKMG